MLPDGSRPVRCHRHACLSGLTNELLPCASDLCSATFPTVRLYTLFAEPSCVEIHEPLWEQTTSLKSLVRGTERPLLSGTLETLLVFWTLTWISFDYSEVESLSSALCFFYFFLFSPLWFSSISFAFPKFSGCMDLVGNKWTFLFVTTFSPNEDLVLWQNGWTVYPVLVYQTVIPGSAGAPLVRNHPISTMSHSVVTQGQFWGKVLEGTGGKK